MARPTDFSPEIATKIIELYTQGHTDAEVAGFIGKHENTLYNWRKANPEFLWATKEAKGWADSIVENSLFRRAVGFEKTYQTEVATKDGVECIQETKYFPPDSTSMIHWLKCRKPNDWNPKTEMEVSVKKQLIGSVTQDELIQFLETELQKLKAIEGLIVQDKIE